MNLNRKTLSKFKLLGYVNPFMKNYKHLSLSSLNSHKFSIQSVKTIIKEPKELKSEYDVVIIGAGHNGMVSAAYLQKAGYSVCVLERRDVIGGAAVTEEIISGFKFSRASYVLSLLRPFIISDLKLKNYGLKFHMREPFSSYTPIKESLWPTTKAKSLLLGSDLKLTCEEIAKFSQKDAKAFVKYEEEMSKIVKVILTLLDSRPPNLSNKSSNNSWLSKMKSLTPLLKAGKALKLKDIPRFHELMTAPAAKILDYWFESEPLKATLATDAVIGTMSGPYTPGTGYVLLHHIMGGIDDKPGAWAYPEGGMGAVSAAIAASASELGAHIFTGHEIASIEYRKRGEGNSEATGVVLQNGKVIKARKAIFSNATPEVTFRKLTNDKNAEELFGADFMNGIRNIDYTSPVTKINVAVDRVPNFSADPNSKSNEIGHHHKCTIHLNCESVAELANSFDQCQKSNVPSEKPMIELVIPSSLDPTLASKGSHVCLLFTQYTPFSPSNGSWENPEFKEKYAQSVFNVIEEYAPGFKKSIVGKEVLTPWDLEQQFGLTGGNIFHGSMSVDQLYWLRPIFSEKCWFPETPVKGLYLCGSGAHPGGGVMGLPGYIAAKALIKSTRP